ncbi:MAG: impB/mucB/samB family protein [Proteobacteria bacterium]|nr:impB/mucB/samB family protein [Pseudomonadota bacterium]
MDFDPQKLPLRWLYIDFNSYFASVEQQLRPELRGKPIAVVPVMTDYTSAIAASYEAKAYGIKTGTPIHEAKRMCPGLICVLATHEHYRDFHERIVDEVEKYIPVSVVASIDEVGCRLMDNETSEEFVTERAAIIKRGLAKNIGEYVKCSIGVAPNRYLAKVATDLKKPDGFTILRAGEVQDKLARIKITDLPGVGRNMEIRLRLAGIGSFADIWALDRKALRRVWGNIWGERMWYFLRGFELPDEETTRGTIGHSHVMAPEFRDPKQAKYVARRLALKTASRLRRLGYYAGVLSFSARLESGYRVQAGEHFYRAQDNKTILEAFESAWQRAIKQAGGARLKKVSVTLYELTAAVDIQPELFEVIAGVDLKARKRSEKLSFAMDKLNQRYGRDTVTLGLLPSQGRSFSGTKIAFTRIPDKEEFLE